MKLNNSLFVSATILLITLCACTTNPNKVDWEREDLIGSWEIAEGCYKALNTVVPNRKIVTLFELNADSTAVFYFGKDHVKIKKAKWKCQSEKKLAYDEFGVSLEHDVIINTEKMGFGMLLENCDGKIVLKAREYSYEKLEK